MMNILRYLSYLVRHKWFVFLACCKLGIPWQGITHDLSKFRADEFWPYLRHFYLHEPEAIGFNRAWLRHIHRNPHHWQHWILHNDSGFVQMLPIPGKVVREMVADWIGASRAIVGKTSDPAVWYRANHYKMQMDLASRLYAEELLGIQRKPIEPSSGPPQDRQTKER